MATSARKKVSVTFAGDDDVVNHIVYAEERQSDLRLRKRSSASRSGSYRNTSKSKNNESDGDSDEENLATPLFGPLQDDNVFVQGADLFQFKSTKKSDQMILKANEARTPRSKSQSEPTPKSKSLRKQAAQGVNQKTPVKRKTGQNGKRIEATTPFRLRKRNHLEGDDSSDDSIDSLSEEGEDWKGSKEAHPPTPSAQSTQRTPRRRPVVDDGHMPDMVGDYFEIQSGGPGPTSDRTLAKLGASRMSESALSNILQSVLTSHKRECAQLVEQHGQLFSQWMYQMCNGFNLLLYGLGSKRSLMEEFRVKILHDFTHLVVNGYFPSLTMKQILNSITEDILDHSANFRNPLDQIDFIKQHYTSEGYEDVYIILNNIDGTMLRAEKTQTMLSVLAQIPGFHIIASIDHINAPLIWDQMKCSRFNWLWYDVTTYLPYTEETSYENSLLVQQTGALALSSLTHVLKSLTLNARRIFLLLAHFQMDNKPGNPAYTGMSFRDMYQRCRESFLVNSDLTLRTQLTEFRDHKLITSKKGHDGMEYLLIPVETATLSEFLETQEDRLTQD
ncbi:origin recognition complex subunit 2-like isoform X2 [Liolophura sinensis]|uniref:origin recognition complex subunit 2-like isoform X2 n=1 Tax=Liolophura sinensis TaxID=3198878 RepID=UPI0031597B7F